jgi:tungstate transport system permease protein
LREIVALSLRVTGSALICASALGLPLGALLGVARFPGRRALVVALNAGMALPPVVVGLLVYLLLSRAGPLGALEWLFTPIAMVIAQTLIVLPIVAALTRQTVEDLAEEYGEQLRAFGASPARSAVTLLYEGRYSLATAVLAGFGRAIAEVGAVIVVGGNIAHVTRVMTTAIALESSRGDLPLALGLGFVLIALALAVNMAAEAVRGAARRVGA